MKVLMVVAVSAVLCSCSGRRGGPVVRTPISTERDATTAPTAVSNPGRPGATAVPSEPILTTAEPAISPSPDLPSIVARVQARLLDVFFDYDRSDLRPDALAALHENTGLLKPVLAEFPHLKVILEGHADERGSAEYNLALGDRRAASSSSALGDLGLPTANVETLSYGKEMPQCTEPSELCWSRNRRVHFVLR